MTRLKDLLDYLDYLDTCSDRQFLKFCDAMEKRGYRFVTQNVLDYDYPHVTHCKDCKYWYQDFDGKCIASTPYGTDTDEDDFCKRAERKEDDIN